MVDFDKFEQNVKNKYGNQEFPFDEQNWEKAAQMIDASRGGKKRGGIFFLSAVALLCTSGLVYYFGFSDSAKSLHKNELAVNQSVTAHEKPVNSNELNEAVNNSIINSSTNSNTENTPSVEENKPHEETSVNDNTSTVHSSKVKTNTKANSTVNNSGAAKNSYNNTAVNNNKNTSVDNATKAETKPNASSANSTNNAKETKLNNTENIKASDKSNTKTSSSAPSENNSSAQNNTIKGVAINTTPAETGNTNREGNLNDDNNVTPTKNNPVVTDSISDVIAVAVKPTESTVVDSVPPMRKSKADSLAAMLPKGDGVSYATNVKEKHNAKNILFMEAGTTYLLGWNGGGKTEAGGFNLLGGVNFQHYFTGTIAAQIGVQYSTIGNLTNTSHTISTVKYDLGVEQDITSIKYQKLHYLVAPVKFTYNLGDKNIFGIGCNVAYLLNSDSKKEKYKTYSSDPNADKKDFTSTKESGYVKGFNPFDIQVGVSYRRRIYKGLSANAEFFYGLTDTKDNSFFKSNYFDRNVGFKVSLCYDLFKK